MWEGRVWTKEVEANRIHRQTRLLAIPTVTSQWSSQRNKPSPNNYKIFTLSVGICDSFSFRPANSMSNANMWQPLLNLTKWRWDSAKNGTVESTRRGTTPTLPILHVPLLPDYGDLSTSLDIIRVTIDLSLQACLCMNFWSLMTEMHEINLTLHLPKGNVKCQPCNCPSSPSSHLYFTPKDCYLGLMLYMKHPWTFSLLALRLGHLTALCSTRTKELIIICKQTWYKQTGFYDMSYHHTCKQGIAEQTFIVHGSQEVMPWPNGHFPRQISKWNYRFTYLPPLVRRTEQGKLLHCLLPVTMQIYSTIQITAPGCLARRGNKTGFTHMYSCGFS